MANNQKRLDLSGGASTIEYNLRTGLLAKRFSHVRYQLLQIQ